MALNPFSKPGKTPMEIGPHFSTQGFKDWTKSLSRVSVLCHLYSFCHGLLKYLWRPNVRGNQKPMALSLRHFQISMREKNLTCWGVCIDLYTLTNHRHWRSVPSNHPPSLLMPNRMRKPNQSSRSWTEDWRLKRSPNRCYFLESGLHC